MRTANRIAVVPGSYDPVTTRPPRHHQARRRAVRRGRRGRRQPVGPQEHTALFSIDERLGSSATRWPRRAREVRVEPFYELVVSYARRIGAQAIVKGLRQISDFEYEMEKGHLNRQQAPDIESVFVMASPQFAFLSSSWVKELARFEGQIDGLVPAPVAAALAERVPSPARRVLTRRRGT